MIGPAAWVRRAIPPCALDWPTLLFCVWWGDRRVGDVQRLAVERSEVAPTQARWLAWVLTPLNWATVIDDVIADAHRMGARGVMLNPELPWKASGLEESARDLCLRVRDAGLEVGFCSYALPSAHPTFPWAAFAELTDVAVSQTYDREMVGDPGYAERCVRQYREAGFRRVLMSVGLNNARGRGPIRPKTPAELGPHLAMRPPQESTVWGGATWGRDVCRLLSRWARGLRGASSSGGGLLLLALALGFGALASSR